MMAFQRSAFKHHFNGAGPKNYDDTQTDDLIKILENFIEDNFVVTEKLESIFHELYKRIDRDILSWENMLVIVHNISRICHYPPDKRKFVTAQLQKFIDSKNLQAKIITYFTGKIKEIETTQSLTFVTALLTILSKAADLMPTYSITVNVTILSLIKSSSNIAAGVNDILESFEVKVNENLTHLRSNNFSYGPREPKNSFRKLSIVPTMGDVLMEGQPFLRKNIIYGPYTNSEQYLDIQFRLIREDFLIPLRGAIQHYKFEKEIKYLDNARIYTGVFVQEIVCKNIGIVLKIKFDVSKLSKVNWETSKRLMQGALVCISKDGFKSLVFATIAEKSSVDLEKGITYIKVDRNDEMHLNDNPFIPYELIESIAYFEACRYQLSALQGLSEKNLPMKDYILNQTTKFNSPLYLKESSEYKLRCLLLNSVKKLENIELENKEEEDSNNSERIAKQFSKVNILNREEWPNAEQIGMDDSQFEALISALTQEFAIIQGPPGTGKTYLGLKIIEVLLRNSKVWSPNDAPKILIACYTNHALDQFLTGILDIFPGLIHRGLIRIGGYIKSSDERLTRCKLNNSIDYNTRLDQHKKEKMAAINNISKLLEAILLGVVDMRELEVFMTKSTCDALYKQYNYIGDYLKETPILVYWLSMGEKYKYDSEKNQCAIVKNTIENEEIENMEETEDIEEVQRISADDVQLRTRSYSERIYAFEFSGKLNLTIDDLHALENKEDLKHMTGEPWYKLYTTRRHFKDVLCHQLAKSDHMDAKEARAIKGYQLWKMNETDRWRLYRYWLLQYYNQQLNVIRQHCDEYDEAVLRCEEERMRQELAVVENASVIGITTTGAAKYKYLIEKLRPKIAVIEEAAEVLEAHVVTSLTDSCEHVILIGDHQQLRPNPTSYELAKKYKLEISLFERMVENKLHLSTLQVQHRMRPEISSFLVPHIYKQLEDHSSVLNYPSVKGVKGNMFFISHQELEQHSSESRSHSNIYEANLIAGFCTYLLHQGYDADKITVLTTYRGQEFVIKRQLNTDSVYLEACNKNKEAEKQDEEKETYKRIRVVTVDNFQGEENNIILLSLVRSNEEGKIGFLKTSNRVCVAISRAKHGFYAFGNMTQLQQASVLWKNILDEAGNKACVVDHIPLVCQNHPDNVTEIRKKEDFKRVPDGGCDKHCETRLECGHVCILFCHPYDQKHEEYICKKACTKSCERGHPCKMLCFECSPNGKHSKCKDCEILVEKTMPKCYHLQKMACHLEPRLHKCEMPCKRLLVCGHDCKLLCGAFCSDQKCEEIVSKSLKCGHVKNLECFKKVTDFVCTEMVLKTLPCGHTLNMECRTDTGEVECHVESEIELKCGHSTIKECHTGIEHVKCNVLMTKELLCGHSIILKCHEYKKDIVCKEKMEIKLKCGHNDIQICHKAGEDIKCAEQVEINTCSKHKVTCLCNDVDVEKEKPCTAKVEVVCPSNHKYAVECHLAEAQFTCTQQCSSTLECGHQCRGRCGMCCGQQKHQSCSATCETDLPCNHRCTGKCGVCIETGYHLPCFGKAEKASVCGHQQRESYCGFSALPCNEKCRAMCSHRSCTKRCGDACQPCYKQCEWKCDHRRCTARCYQLCNREICNKACLKQLKCGHPCRGFCGEPCLTSCIEQDCQKNMYINIAKRLDYFAGNNIRYVRLQPCNHVINGYYMDEYMRKEWEKRLANNEIECYRCPYCQDKIEYCPRYSKYIKETNQHICKVQQLILAENYKLDFLFTKNQHVVNIKLSYGLILPTWRDLFTAGIICLLQATLTGFRDLKLKIQRNMNSSKNDKLQYIFDLELNDVDNSGTSIKKKIDDALSIYHSATVHADAEVFQLTKLAAWSIECFLKVHIASLDQFINNHLKRKVLENTAKMLLDLEGQNSTIQNQEQNRNVDEIGQGNLMINLAIQKKEFQTFLDIVRAISVYVGDHFTAEQLSGLTSLMEQIWQLFCPVTMYPENNEKWIICERGAYHLKPCQSSLFDQEFKRQTCDWCEQSCALRDLLTDDKIVPKTVYKTQYQSMKVKERINYNGKETGKINSASKYTHGNKETSKAQTQSKVNVGKNKNVKQEKKNKTRKAQSSKTNSSYTPASHHNPKDTKAKTSNKSEKTPASHHNPKDTKAKTSNKSEETPASHRNPKDTRAKTSNKSEKTPASHHNPKDTRAKTSNKSAGEETQASHCNPKDTRAKTSNKSEKTPASHHNPKDIRAKTSNISRETPKGLDHKKQSTMSKALHSHTEKKPTGKNTYVKSNIKDLGENDSLKSACAEGASSDANTKEKGNLRNGKQPTKVNNKKNFSKQKESDQKKAESSENGKKPEHDKTI